MSYARFAIYYIPPDGPLADFGAAWLGWDVLKGCAVPQCDLPGLHDITMTPRKYGFHGTLKPPLRLRDGLTQVDLGQAVAALAAQVAPAICDGLELSRIGRFLALTPAGPVDGLTRVAGDCVRALDRFRAPASAAELDRRRQAGLTPRQEANLTTWGYPYVMDDFRFHMTLSGQLTPEALPQWEAALRDRLPALPTPFALNEIALCGAGDDGRFALIHRYALTGSSSASARAMV
ncbi:DUF1045 domain-containing protein [Loktanella sp. TSTF-M6]|uniref:DUF1045 domain-containing protein n=1 Tax=Loktanella gaetbuli TaxID=2881335 RepID=A0ABS8BYD3_9RHOB|nr:DUF1045 domain-containing protein [Loktanella gaetbuli]MCB5200720.1 DUF1045 domain-containing protein [Loktanella gaetbuli]